jgi:hypothetical protein
MIIFIQGASMRQLRAENARLERVAHNAIVSERQPVDSRTLSTPAYAAERPSKAAGALGKVVIANVGRTTPQDALATATWALRTGDVDLAASTMALEPSSRNKIEIFLHTLPDHLQSEYRTPERLIATLFMSGQLLTTVSILSQRNLNAGLVSQRIEYEFSGESSSRQDELLFQQSPDGWTWMIPAGLVERSLGIFKQRAPNQVAEPAPTSITTPTGQEIAPAPVAAHL